MNSENGYIGVGAYGLFLRVWGVGFFLVMAAGVHLIIEPVYLYGYRPIFFAVAISIIGTFIWTMVRVAEGTP